MKFLPLVLMVLFLASFMQPVVAENVEQETLTFPDVMTLCLENESICTSVSEIIATEECQSSMMDAFADFTEEDFEAMMMVWNIGSAKCELVRENIVTEDIINEVMELETIAEPLVDETYTGMPYHSKEWIKQLILMMAIIIITIIITVVIREVVLPWLNEMFWADVNPYSGEWVTGEVLLPHDAAVLTEEAVEKTLSMHMECEMALKSLTTKSPEAEKAILAAWNAISKADAQYYTAVNVMHNLNQKYKRACEVAFMNWKITHQPKHEIIDAIKKILDPKAVIVASTAAIAAETAVNKRTSEREHTHTDLVILG